MSEWIDIKSAPKDGSEFQAWIVTEDGDGFWEPRCRYNEEGRLGMWGWLDYDIDGFDYCLSHLYATHWMPQPEAPK